MLPTGFYLSFYGGKDFYFLELTYSTLFVEALFFLLGRALAHLSLPSYVSRLLCTALVSDHRWGEVFLLAYISDYWRFFVYAFSPPASEKTRKNKGNM